MNASNSLYSFITFTPMSMPYALKLGVNNESSAYAHFLHRLGELCEASNFQVAGRQHSLYRSIDIDGRDSAYLIWQRASESYEMRIKLYPSATAIAEITWHNLALADELESKVQSLSEALIRDSYPILLAEMTSLFERLNSPLLSKQKTTETTASPSLYWTSRCLLLDAEQCRQSETRQFVQRWLAKTERPEDADEIISGLKDHSMTWLNYVVVNCQQDDYRIATMSLAQYIYTAQEKSIKQLKKAIASAYLSAATTEARTNMQHARVEARMHLIAYHDHLKYLTRPKRKLLKQIMLSWEFQGLVDNSHRMIEVCSSKLEEVDRQRRERSTIMTDLLLVTLSFLAVFELSLYLTEISREMMSRPALIYKDEGHSHFLSTIAAIDTDMMVGAGCALTLGLIIAYRFIKTR